MVAGGVAWGDLEALREGWDFEAKLAAGRGGRGKLPDDVWKTYSAMANAGGGYILLGAKERPDGSMDLAGIADVDKVEAELWSGLQNPQKASANLLVRDDVQRVSDGSATVLLVHVPKAAREFRPVYVNGSWQKGTYIRVYDGDRQVSIEDAR